MQINLKLLKLKWRLRKEIVSINPPCGKIQCKKIKKNLPSFDFRKNKKKLNIWIFLDVPIKNIKLYLIFYYIRLKYIL